MTEDLVVLVDEHGVPCGTAEKLAAHVAPGLPHKAFSLVVTGRGGRILLQRRADAKHHFRGRWSNSCCSHPRPGEAVVAAAARRAREELGMGVTDIEELGTFWYRAVDPETGLVEHELDTVLTGCAVGPPRPVDAEVAAVAWVAPAEARRRCEEHPDTVTPWLSGVLDVLAQVDA